MYTMGEPILMVTESLTNGSLLKYLRHVAKVNLKMTTIFYFIAQVNFQDFSFRKKIFSSLDYRWSDVS